MILNKYALKEKRIKVFKYQGFNVIINKTYSNRYNFIIEPFQKDALALYKKYFHIKNNTVKTCRQHVYTRRLGIQTAISKIRYIRNNTFNWYY